MKEMKRILSLVLCLAMLVGMMPMFALNADAATGEVIDAAIFCSDVHTDTSAVSSVFKQIAGSATYTTATFCGDTYSDGSGNSSEVTGVAQAALGNTSLQGFYVWGDHDDASDIVDDSGLVYGSGEGENYYIYVLSMADMDNDYSAEEAAAEMAEFTAAVEMMDKTKPLFIASHQPLHARRSDNVRAAEWTDVINAAGEQMDIVFFWGHNHTGDGSVDQAVYYVAKGETLNVETTSANSKSGAGTSSSSTGVDKTINFTYMNAGYIGKSGGRGGYATTVLIYADALVFQDYNSSGAVADGEYTHNVEVSRKFASSGDSGSTEETTAPTDATEDTTPTVNTVKDTEDTTQDIVTAVGLGLTGVTLTVSETADTSAFQSDCAAYDVALEGYIEGETVTLTFDVAEMTSADLVVHANGVQAEIVSVEDVTAEDGFCSVKVTVETTSATGTYVIGKLAAAEDAVLKEIVITDNRTIKSYTLLDSVDGKNYLDITGLVVTAVYDNGQEIPVEWDRFGEIADGYALTFDMSQVGAQDVVVTYGGMTATFPITVYENTATDISADETVAAAVAEVLKEGYVARDIEATGYVDGTAIRVVMSAPEGANAVYHVAEDGTLTKIENAQFADGVVTFTTEHFSNYVVGETTVTVEDPQTATGTDEVTTTTTKTVYVLSSRISSGNSYLIANSASAGSVNLVANDGGDLSNTTATVVYGDCDGDGDSEYYIELTDATNELWTVAGSYTFENQDEYLRCSSGSLSVSSQSTTWSYSSNRLSYRSDRSTYYLRYNNGWTVTNQSGSASSIYFYVPTEVEAETTTTVSGTYAISGKDISVVAVEGAEALLDITLTFEPASGSADIADEDVSAYATYEVVSDLSDIIEDEILDGVATLTGNTGEALVKVSYVTDFGTVTNYVTIEAKAPYYSINLHKAALTVATGVTADNVTNYYVYNTTTGVYEKATSYVEGTTYYTTPVVKGDEITAPIALKGIEAGDTYAVWAVVKKYDGVVDEKTGEDGVDQGALGEALHWSVSDESIATIDTSTGVLTFTGTNYGTFKVTVSYEGDDGKVVTDTITISVTKSLYTVPGDGTNDFPEYPNEGAVRFDKHATAVGNFSETGIALVELSMTGVPYSTGSEIDVVVMLDMSTSMDDDRIAATVAATKVFLESIVKNEDGTYNDNRVYVGYFNGDTVYTITGTDNIGGELESVDNDTEYDALLAAIEDEYDGALTASGTNYDVSLEECYNVLTAAKTDGTGDDRDQFVVFMSDGGPTDYATSSSNVVSESTVNGWFTISDSDSANWTNSMVEEYWSGLMKDNGVTIYSVGLILQEAPTSGPSTYRDYTADQNYYVTSTLLTGIASGADYFINCESSDDTAEMEGIFANIAQKILEAATDVVVEDKVGDDYSINFSIPGYGTTNAVSEDALDGTTEFYIQVVEYQLDADKERTGTPAVRENFTFNADGTLKSHTVDGTACSSCSHVTTSNGAITAIDGTYFDYKSDSTGEYLTWNAEKLTTTELALQYFAHLDNSTGVPANEQVPAGTYYTNEYATLTYTNYQGNRVQQEFPIPQMTWNGAQVSYVFYLVNAAGQPVNRAGKVVPFAEAVYVTDVHTFHVVWNDLEQSAGLEAAYLAENLVPDVYALYDDDASYNIHVYEDESAVNLNNHFIIGGDVTDDYNTTTNSWTNAKTTYVFNAKSDATKYNTVGTYIANDGNDNTATTSYFCKSSAIEGATFTTAVDASGNTVYTVTSANYQTVTGETQVTVAELVAAGGSTTGGTTIGDYIYYVDEHENVYTIVRKTDGTEVRTGFDFSNTTVAFAVVWKPELKEDTVVVDYGLDVVIDVTTNDGLASGVVGVRADKPDAVINSGIITAAKAQSVDLYIDANNDDGNLKELKIGTATVENLTSVRFSLDKSNGMQFTDAVVFYYESEVNYYEGTELQKDSMYSSVTVIPATSVYYEDDFLTFASYTKNADGEYVADETHRWVTKTQSGTQEQDRPGESKISADLDADNNYGYDKAYETMSTFSMGSAAKFTVTADTRGEASFTFYGTGFDVIGLTSNDTGTLMVEVTDANGTNVRRTIVDTYYGYKRVENDDGTYSWETTTANDPNALYQVPVIKISGLTYGQYTVKLIAAYNNIFNHTGTSGKYDLYLDAVRIYDPTGNQDKTSTDAYIQDGEGYPVYTELRDLIIRQNTFSTLTTEEFRGIVFIDGGIASPNIDEYKSFGPNNELYLAAGQAVAAKLNGNGAKSIQLAVKTVGDEATVEVYGIDSEGNKVMAVAQDISTATDMYFDITELDGMTLVIKNSGDSGIISITNIKCTYKSAPTASASEEEPGQYLLTVNRSTAGIAVASMVADVEPVPETTVPETTEPEVTEPNEEEETKNNIDKIINGLIGWILGE